MFSRVRLRPEDAAYHRFLWKEDEAADPVVYQMDRLTFRDRCSPFVAIATTRKTAADHSDDPLIRKAILENLYMDDYLDSTRTIEEAIERAKGVRDTLAKGDFHLQAWTSNSPAFVAALSPTESSDGAATQPMLAVNDGATKVLGVGWKPTTDQLSFVIDSMEEMRFSRLHLASFVARIFDPLGLAAPWIVKAKIKLRELDVRGVIGKDPLPPDILSWWIDWAASLAQLKSLEIPRCLFPEEEKIIQSELHAFTDASEETFAAAVYVRNVRADGNVDVRLLIAKTKIAAKKVISIPKSELQAALMGARLANYVKSALTVPIIKRRFWTDSSCVRNWVRSTSAYYKPFVSHRIGEIQTLTDAAEWRFVPGRLNSSDLATRSVVKPIPAEWFDGPAFLQKNEEDWPTDLPWLAVREEIRTAKNFRLTSTCHVPDDKIDWTSLQIKESDLRALAQKKTSHLKIIRQCQEEAFSEDINRLKKKKELKPSSKLISLTPFLDRDGLLRLGGRLRRAPLPLENRHPILLPVAHPLTEKIIEAFHRGFLHAGTDFVLSQIQNHFWIIQGKEAVKKIRRKCPECIKDRVRPATQLMGELTYFRLEACTPPFYRTAVDYFGPFEVGFARNRTTKRYGALFTCLVTRAVYVDLAKSLSSDDFLLVFRRFISLCGAPRCVYSDNGTNFVGAEKEITADIKQLQESDGLKKIATEKSIDIRFQPPSSPHFGGAHESLVKSVKKALYRALAIEEVAHRYPTEETMRTLLFEVGGILNARPVTTFSSDPADFRPLTPNDFMNRSSTDHVPPGSFQDALPREQYRYLQRALGLFWDLWKGVYLQSLAARKKWRNPSGNLAVGDAVLISDPRQPRASWTVGRVTQVYPGEDQLVRVVKVKTEDGEYQKPIHRLCLLAPVEDSGCPASRPDSGEDGTAPTEKNQKQNF